MGMNNHTLETLDDSGGLAYCTTCGGAEASLPKHCPGFKMPSEIAVAVQDGKLEYLHGVWWRPCKDPVKELRQKASLTNFSIH